MNFSLVVLSGLIRRPVRTGLTIFGIAIGIGAVVALVGLSRGFESSWTSGMNARGTDIVVNNLGSSLTPKPFNAAAAEKVAALPQVAQTSALLVELMGVENASMLIVSGREWGKYEWDNLKIIEGRLPHDATEPAVVLGRTAADMLQKKVGDPLQLDLEELTVTGIVDGGALVENGAVILSLNKLQQIVGQENRINILDVKVQPGLSETETRALCETINQLVPEAKAQLAAEHIEESQGYRFIRAMSWGTSLIAVLVGVMGIMNTMLMTVFERTHEFCILLALGWKRSRIMFLVLCESALLGLFGGLLGVVVGIIGVHFMEKTPAMRGLLESDLSPSLLLTSVVLAVLIGLLSGLYPAWRSSRLPPSLVMHG